MSKSPFADWRSELRRLGFKALGTGGRTGTYLGRDVAWLQQGIGVLVADHRDGAFNIQLNINMPLRCAEPPHDVVILEADLAPRAVTIGEPWVHDPAHATWWPPDQKHAAWEALLDLGLKWLDRYSDVATLTQYFEREYARHEEERLRRESPGWLAAVARKLRVVDPPKRTGHLEYLLWLSMLYEVGGRLGLARERLTAYATAVAPRNIAGEAERLERHRRALNSAES